MDVPSLLTQAWSIMVGGVIMAHFLLSHTSSSTYPRCTLRGRSIIAQNRFALKFLINEEWICKSIDSKGIKKLQKVFFVLAHASLNSFYEATTLKVENA
jgi:hypothetical protein